jgi:hypothetical protein
MMSLFKKLKNSKSFSVFSHHKSNYAINNTNSNTNTINHPTTISNNSSPLASPNGNTNERLNVIVNNNKSGHGNFLNHTKSFLSNKIKGTTVKTNASSDLEPPHTVINESFNSDNNSTLSTTTGSPGSKVIATASVNTRTLIVYHIDSETEGSFTINVKDTDLGQNVLDRVCEHYNLSEYKEYFGLKYTHVNSKGDHEIFWLDSLKTMHKQLKRDSHNVLTFRVKHFPGRPAQIQSEYVRYLIYLQLRNYLLKSDMGSGLLTFSEETRLASFAVQACLGDFHDNNKETYLDEIRFLPRVKLSPKAIDTIVELHKALAGKTPAQMELAFLERVSQFDTYGAELIIVKNSKGVEINFGVSHNGIITYLQGQALNMSKTGVMSASAASSGNGTLKIGIYPWTQIGKISYEGRTLKVHAHTPDIKNSEVIKKHVMVFKCGSKSICKHLWKFILDQKSFFSFKRGTDVPKVKSSSSFFHHRSKFRFSGRCESELIKSQNKSNSNGTASAAAGGGGFTSLNISPISSQISPYSSFKRRSFIKTQHSTMNNIQQKKDANNNNHTLLMIKEKPATTTTTTQMRVESDASSDNDQSYVDTIDDEHAVDAIKPQMSYSSKLCNLSETESTGSRSTVIYHNTIENTAQNPVNLDPSRASKASSSNNSSIGEPTPQLYAKKPYEQQQQQQTHKNYDSDDSDQESEDENETDQFYDHDKCENNSTTPNGFTNNNSCVQRRRRPSSDSCCYNWFLILIKVLFLLIFIACTIKSLSYLYTSSSCLFSKNCFSLKSDNNNQKSYSANDNLVDPIFYWFRFGHDKSAAAK